MVMIEFLCGPNASQLVRAVVPIDPKTWSPQGSWFMNGIQAQSEIVTRDASGIPDSIELVAQVGNLTPNVVNTLTYEFRAGVPALAAFAFPDLGWFRVECIDEQNRPYLFRFASSDGEVVKNGQYQRITRFASTLAGNGKNLLGVIVLLTQNAKSNLFDFEIFAHNGLVANVIGNVYCKSITIYSEAGHDFYPKACSKRPCGTAISGGYAIATTNYFWPKQAGFTRRFVCAAKTDDFVLSTRQLAYRQVFGGTGFATQWPNSFGVAKTRLGAVTNSTRHYGFDGNTYYGRAAIKRQSFEDFLTLRDALNRGDTAEWVGVYSIPYGPFHPFYFAQQGAVSGAGINHYAGWKLCWEELAANYLFAAMNVERQPWNTWRDSGTPKTVDDYAAEGNGVVQFDFAPFDFDINGVPAFRNAGDYNVGSSSREIAVFQPHDAHHQARFTKPLQALACNNDYMAKELLGHAAEVNYLYLNLYPQVAGWSGGHNLKKMLEVARANQRQGGLMDRGRCWPVDCIMAYYHVASPQWRARIRPWIEKMTECLILSQMPTGWNNRRLGDGGSQTVVTAALPPQFDVAQTFEVEFEDWIKRCLATGLPSPNRFRTMLNHSILRSAKSLFTSNLYNGSTYRWFVAVGDNHGNAFTQDQLQRELSSGGNEIFQGWYILHFALLAAKELKNEENNWLDIALTYRESVASPQLKAEQLSNWASETWNDHMPQAIGLMGELQQ